MSLADIKIPADASDKQTTDAKSAVPPIDFKVTRGATSNLIAITDRQAVQNRNPTDSYNVYFLPAAFSPTSTGTTATVPSAAVFQTANRIAGKNVASLVMSIRSPGLGTVLTAQDPANFNRPGYYYCVAVNRSGVEAPQRNMTPAPNASGSQNQSLPTSTGASGGGGGGGVAGLTSINGDTTAAQTLTGAKGISVADLGGGAHTVSSPLTTKGDIFGYDTNGNRIPVGADGTVLAADSTAALGVSYKGGLVQIAKIVTAASQASVDFTSIPANFVDLEVRWQARSNVFASSEVMSVNVNGDVTGADYTPTQFLSVNGATVSAGSIAASALGIAVSSIVGASGTTAADPGEGVTRVNNYLSTIFGKRINTNSSWGTITTGPGNVGLASGDWHTAAAVTRLTFTTPTSFVNGSTFTLYGIGH